MSKKLLISDANIIIDIVVGELQGTMFALDYEFGTPDILYVEELEQHHSEIIDAGLVLFELKPNAVNYAHTLYQQNLISKLSVNDCIALALAQQESCALLTGDAKLKQLAIIEDVSVRGTLWLVEEMLKGKLINASESEIAYQKMLDDGSRLPVEEIKKQLNRYKSKN